MAYRRCLSIRAALLSRRSNPSFCYISHEDDHAQMRQPTSRCDGWKTMLSLYPSHEDDCGKPEEYRPSRSAIDSYVKSNSWQYSGVSFGVGSGFVGSGLCKNRYMSTSSEAAADELKKKLISDFPALGEIIPAAESSLPVLAVQYLIDAVHSLTGLNWWASIALTTLLIRGVTIPFLIYEAKSYEKRQCSEILNEVLLKEAVEGRHILKGMDPKSRAETVKRLQGLCDMSTVIIFEGFGNLLKGMAIRGPVFASFILAVTIMVHEVPSFKSGGAFWFTDLTTPDYTFILPSLTLLSFLASHRYFWREKITRSNHFAFRELNLVSRWKLFSGLIATTWVLLLPLSIILPKIVCRLYIATCSPQTCFPCVLIIISTILTLGRPWDSLNCQFLCPPFSQLTLEERTGRLSISVQNNILHA